MYSTQIDLSLHDGILLFQGRIVVLESQRKQRLNKIHTEYQGINRCLRRAREFVWWLRMSQRVKEMIQSCNTCVKYSKKDQKDHGRSWHQT